MNRNSNIYTVIYATILVIIVAAVLAFVSSSLKEKQQKNVDTETKSTILLSADLAKDVKNAENKDSYIEKEWNQYITNSFLVDYRGQKIEGDAFTVNLKEQYDIIRNLTGDNSKDRELLSKLRLPVFECTLDNGQNIKIFSVYGAGLWGAIWGYVSVKDDYQTIYGATFAHASETPGLGAEIATTEFGDQFRGKQLFFNDKFTSVKVKKGGATPGVMNEVDAITGGTITSNALEKTIYMWFERYLPYMNKNKEVSNE